MRGGNTERFPPAYPKRRNTATEVQEIRASAQLIRALAEDIIDEIATVFAVIGGICIETDNRDRKSDTGGAAARAQEESAGEGKETV